MSLAATALRYACLPFSFRPIPASHCVAVLAYHSISDMCFSDFSLPPSRFDEQLEYLNRNTELVGPEVLNPGFDFDRPRPRPAAILTFDDAYADFYEIVFPRLCKLDLLAILFIPAGAVDNPQYAEQSFSVPLCSWSRLREMSDSGHVIPASHGYRHCSAHQLSTAQQQSELIDSKNLIEDRLGRSVQDFAWPFGHWSRSALRLAKGLYSRIWGFQGGAIRSDIPLPEVLPRIPIRRGDSPKWFQRKLRGSASLEDRVRSQYANRRARLRYHL